MLMLAIAVPFTPEPTVNVEKKLESPLPPSTVTRLVSDAPLPDVVPLMMVLAGMFSVPNPSRMDAGEEKAVELKLMSPAPAVADASSASRRLHAVSVVLTPGVLSSEQFEAEPASSTAELTTKSGI